MSLESRAPSVEKEDAYVRNSSFLSRDIEAQKTFAPKNSSPKRNITPPKNNNITSNTSPPRNLISPPKRAGSIVTAKKEIIGSPPKKEENNSSPPTNKFTSPAQKETSPPVNKNVFATLQNHNEHKDDNLTSKNNIITLSTKVTSTPKADKMTSFSGGVTSNIIKFNNVDVKSDEDSTKNNKDLVITKEIPIKTEKLSLPATKNNEISDVNDTAVKSDQKKEDIENVKEGEKSEETNGVGDKIRKFEKAAEDASASVGRLSRPGSVRRGRTDRLGSDSKDDLPPPATPFKDNIFFDSGSIDKVVTNSLNHKNSTLERQHSIKGSNVAAKWQKNENSSVEDKIQKPEPQKIIKPEFKPMQSPVDLTIRSPSLGAKIPDQFPSQGTAFRNVASPDTARSNINKINEDNLKAFKLKNKQKLCVSKGTSYFSRVSDEVWLVKKKDIEEIEERVLDSFRRAGGNVCMRSETMRPSSDSGQGASFTHATLGRKRQMYARSESLDPQWAGARAQTLKRQSSVACTCGHDKKTKGKSGPADTTPRPRSRSHGDENNQSHVLDKYETLV